jgi:hypothetical protein
MKTTGNQVLITAVLSVLTLTSAVSSAQESPQARASSDSVNYQQAVQRGTQAVIWGIPLVAMQALRESAARDLGATYNDVIYMSKPPAPPQAILTPTTETPYVVLKREER